MPIKSTKSYAMRLLPAGALLIAAATMSAAISIPRLPGPIDDAANVANVLDSAGVPYDTLAYANWPAYDYKPAVKFRIAHTGDAILLHFVVKDCGAKASVTASNGPVFRDACVEFFVSPTANTHYYNFEMNCIGTLLLQGGRRGPGRQLADSATICAVKRFTSLGKQPIDVSGDTIEWEASVIIPREAYFLDSIKAFDGMTMTANIYKCGGAELNYISWRPIAAPRPQFHRPDCFDTLQFESFRPM